MLSYLKYIVGILHLVLLNPILSGILHENTRVKREEGYVYDRPSVSFDLPTRPTTADTQSPVTERTQTPAVDRTQSQYMYYAYPAPSSGDTVNIGYSTGNAAGSIAAGGGGGSVGGGGGNGGTGYNYGTQNSGTSAAQTVSTGLSVGGAGGYNYGTQSSGTSATQTASTGSGSSGYNYNSSGPTVGTNQSPITASTNAPKYLPPVSNGGVTGANTGVTVNIPSGRTATTPASSPAPTTSSAGINIAKGLSDAGYLPPSLSPSPQSTSVPGLSPPNPVTETPSGYLPPVISTPGSTATQNTVSTPASTYLPPVF